MVVDDGLLTQVWGQAHVGAAAGAGAGLALGRKPATFETKNLKMTIMLIKRERERN